MIASQNPATGEVLQYIREMPTYVVNAKLDVALNAQREWAHTPVDVRAQLLTAVAGALRTHKQELATLAALEMGKPIVEAEAEIEKCAWNFDYYAQAAPSFLQDHPLPSSASDSRLVYEPLGLVLAVMPWNYPFWQVMRAAAPVLAGGNGLVLKHASNVPQCALAIERIVAGAGAPAGLLTTLLVPSDRVGALIDDPRIAAVTFTGSTPAGREIAARSGRALKKHVLELGGSDPFVVLADADIEAAAQAAVKARFQNTGQSCIAAKRFIVEDAIADRFVEAFCAGVSRLVVGDPLSMDVTQGSMAKASLRDELHAQVIASQKEGAAVLLGGHALQGDGAFYAPTVLDGVTPGMTAAREETFGPVAAVMRVSDIEEALRIANGTPFGLGAAVWTRDIDRANHLARRIDAGAVFINGVVASDPRLPFGGTKASGYGRELGMLGLHEFMNIKTLWTGPATL